MPINVTTSRVIGRAETLFLEPPAGFSFNFVTRDGVRLTIDGAVQLLASSYLPASFVGIRFEPSAVRSSTEISSTGSFRVVSTHADNVFVYGVLDYGVLSSLSNAGVMEVRGRVFATGIEPQSSSFTLHNSGRLSVSAERWAYGVDMQNGGTVANSGLLEVYSDNLAVGVQMAFGNNGVPVNTSFINSGSLVVTSGPGGQSIGILTSQQGFPQIDRFVNTGLISAEIAFLVAEDDDPASFGTQQSILNYGVIRGDVVLGRGDDEVVNSGLMTGLIDLGEGRDVYDGRGSDAPAGVVLGGGGDDQLYGGAGNDILYGETGRDDIFGGDGDDFIDAGRDGDLIDGGRGFDTLSYAYATRAVRLDLIAGEAEEAGRDLISGIEHVIGSRHADTLRGSNDADLLEGRDGADILEGRAGDDVLIGGRGHDRLIGGAGNDDFVFSLGDGRDIIEDFSIGGIQDRLMIFGYPTYKELRQNGADTLVILSDTDSIRLQGVLASSLTAADFVFDPSPHVVPDLPNNDLYLPIIREQFVVSLEESLIFTNTLAPIILALEPVLFDFIPPPSFYNAGMISVLGTTTERWTTGVYVEPAYGNRLYAGSTILNAAGAVIEAHSTTQREAAGIAGQFVLGSIYNAGRITVTSDHGNAYGIEAGTVSTLVNIGTIEVNAGETARGVSTGLSMDFHNLGDIIVRGGLETQGSASVGVSVETSSLTNSGRIIVTEETDSFSIGLYLARASASTVILNTGYIQADYVVYDTTDMYKAVGPQIYNTGEMHGDIAMLYGRSEVHNAGLITGETRLFDGDDYFDGRLGIQGAVFGETGSDVMLGGRMNDVLDGGSGNDFLLGGGGVDRLTGGEEADTFGFVIGDGNDTVTDFTNGVDVISLSGYGTYQSVIQDGNDAVVVLSATDSLRLTGVQASTITSANFVFNAALPAAGRAFPTVTAPPAIPDMPQPALPSGGQQGTAGVDILNGTSGSDRLFGQDGDDQLSGGAGNDILRGGNGADVLRGGTGNDDIDGGSGDDVLIVSGAFADYRIAASRDAVFLKGPEGFDRLVNIEEIRFGDGQVARLSGTNWQILGSEDDGRPLILPGQPDKPFEDQLVQPTADLAASSGNTPLVLPGLADDDFLSLKGASQIDRPLTWPGELDEADTSDTGHIGGEGVSADVSNGSSGNDGGYGLWGMDPGIQRALDDHIARLDQMRDFTQVSDPWS